MAQVYILGAGTPTPTPTRFGSAQVIEVAGRYLMFDCRPAAIHKLAQALAVSAKDWHSTSWRPVASASTHVMRAQDVRRRTCLSKPARAKSTATFGPTRWR